MELLENRIETGIFILMDANTEQFCQPKIEKFLPKNIVPIIIKSGEKYKNLNSVAEIWTALSENGANRKSILLNLGGGVVCDMGGFAASTFKRGIDFIHIPTTLLSQVDASVGGKTGFDFHGLKNEIGCFSAPSHVIINPIFLNTLDIDNLKSGFAEMLKHAMIFDKEHFNNLKKIDFKSGQINFEELLPLIKKSVSIKNYFINKDPYEKDIRKALNFGHTFGHAFESFFLGTENEILHGKAVAIGMIFELFISVKKTNLKAGKLDEISRYLNKIYGKIKFTKVNYQALFELMQHDKKNSSEQINCTLLKDIGTFSINESITKEEIFEAFDYYLYSM